ncbi:hypothetical protein PsorP6_015011 [Peronosclerospora sorghi]|uniref:Uncharacterized protein n=1 Tax=Peronosclerospora sorghi TaxID=230839 RepID=A0ACC0VSX0_9STRA|nr:hypothetical protein PsorP6_015011 [Peronosclerospora sorghi]
MKKNTNVYKEDVMVERETYKNVVLTEWELSEQQDVILGNPWLLQFNPSIAWRIHEVNFLKPDEKMDLSELEERLKNGHYAEI